MRGKRLDPMEPAALLAFDCNRPELEALYEYWRGKAGNRSMPARGDLDPVLDMPEITPHMWILDVEHDPIGLRYRLVGTQIVANYGTDLTGKRLDEIDLGADRDAILREYAATLESKVPRYSRHQIEISETGRYLVYERLLLPLSDDGETVNMVLAAGFMLDIPLS